MSEDELWQGLTGPRPTDPAGTDASSAVLNTVAVLGTDLGRLSARLDQATRRLEDQDERLARTLGPVLERLDMVERLAGQVGELAAAVADLDQGGDEPPPRPWNWSAMSPQEQRDSVELLGTWVRDVLFTRWPWTQHRLRWCWAYHPELLQDLGLLHVAYRQAYEHPGRRTHHETDFRHALHEVMASAPDVFVREGCPENPGRHRVGGPARDDQRHWRLAAAGDGDGDGDGDGPWEPAGGSVPEPEPEPEPAARDRDRLLARLHALNEQARNHALPQEHRDQARSQMAELVRGNGISQEEYREFRRRLNRINP
jgi:hypothetical protein